MNEVEKLINVLKQKENDGYEKFEIVHGTSDAYIETTPIREALEKQIPKTVIHDTYDDTFHCPDCDSDITDTDYTYCPYCGIRFGDVTEVTSNEN